MRRAAAVARRLTHARRCRPRPPRAQQRPRCRRAAAARRKSTPHRAVAADRAVAEATVMRDELDLRLVDVAALHASKSPVLIAPPHANAALTLRGWCAWWLGGSFSFGDNH